MAVSSPVSAQVTCHGSVPRRSWKRNGSLSSGDLIAFVLYLNLFFAPIQQLSQVFDRLWRGDADTEGSGIGLAVVLWGRFGLDDPATQALPGAYQRLIPLLRAILVEMGDADNAPAQPHRFDDAQWVGMRFAEILPIPAAAKQTLLEVDDSVDRLEIISRFLASKSLLPDE